MTARPVCRRAAFMLAAAAGSACAEFAPGEPELRLEIAVSPTPATVGSARVLLTLSDTAGAMRGGATVVVSGRSPTGRLRAVDTASEIGLGRYVVESFPFDTNGEWSLEASARLAGGGLALAEHPIRVVGPPPGR